MATRLTERPIIHSFILKEPAKSFTHVRSIVLMSPLAPAWIQKRQVPTVNFDYKVITKHCGNGFLRNVLIIWVAETTGNKQHHHLLTYLNIKCNAS